MLYSLILVHALHRSLLVRSQAVSVPSGDELIQLAYADAIRPYLTEAPLGKGQVLYVCPPTQQGIAGGQWVPSEVTNAQIYTIGDYLLPENTPVFIPGSGSYIRTLKTYLSWVKLNNNPNNGEKIRYTNALAASNSAADAFTATREKAIAAFNDDPDNDMGFDDWSRKYYTKYGTAYKANQQAAGNLYAAMTKYWGVGADALKQDIERVDAATDPAAKLQKGINMPAIYQDLSKIDSNFQAASNGETPDTTVEGSFTLPEYYFSEGSYKETVNNWVNNYGKNPATINIDISAAKSMSWSQNGFSKITAGIDASYWFFFRARAKFEKTESTRSLDTSRASSEIQLKLVCEGGAPAKFNIAQGSWDVKNVTGVYPDLLSGAPTNIIPSMVQVKSVLLAYGVSMQVKFSGQTLKDVQNMVNTAKSTGGSIRIFGFDIGGSASGSYQETQNTAFNSVQWDSNSGTFTLPAADNGYPILLGVLGQRLKQ